MLKIEEIKGTLGALTTPLLIVKVQENSTDHLVYYLNPAFERVIGYTLDDIPDKNSWWQKAYPDPAYRKAVESQWELLFQEACEKGHKSISLEVDIQTKNNAEKRFRVYAEIESNIAVDCYIVMFANPDLDTEYDSVLDMLRKDLNQ